MPRTILDEVIWEFGYLDTRSQNVIERLKIMTFGELIQFSREDLLAHHQVGKVTVRRIEDHLQRFGLSLRDPNKK